METQNKTDVGGKQLIHFQGNLKKYNAKRKFKGAIEGVMMANMLQRVLQAGKAAAVEKIMSPATTEQEKIVAADAAPAAAVAAPAADVPATPVQTGAELAA